MANAYFNFKPFDYEKILENYIQLVGDAEGVDFLGETYKPKETVLDLNEKEETYPRFILSRELEDSHLKAIEYNPYNEKYIK